MQQRRPDRTVEMVDQLVLAAVDGAREQVEVEVAAYHRGGGEERSGVAAEALGSAGDDLADALRQPDLTQRVG